jgi:acetoin utilization protein AcuC
MHRRDPLADLSLSLRGIVAAYRRVVALSEELCDGRMVVTGGGGYDPYRTVPRAWAHLWAALVGGSVPERLPASWRDQWRERSPVSLPEWSLDDGEGTPIPRRQAIASHNRAVAERLMEVLTTIWRERGDAGPPHHHPG